MIVAGNPARSPFQLCISQIAGLHFARTSLGMITMSATLPPGTDGDRASDFGEFWRRAEDVPAIASVVPEAEIPLQLLSPEQVARRLRLRRAVGGVVAGLLAFTALAACLYLVRDRAAAVSGREEAKLPAAASSQPGQAAPARLASAATQLVASAASSEESDRDRALALARQPVATIASFQAWSQLARHLSPADRQRAEHDLSRATVTGARAGQEAARLELALLWRATGRRAKAQKVLVSLARTATDPVVKKYALGALNEA